MSPQVQHLWVFSLTSLFWSLYAPSADHITLVQPGCLSFPDERRQKWRNCQVSSGRLLAVLLSWFNPSLSEWSELRWTNQNLWYDRSSTPSIHTKFSNTCWTGARFCARRAGDSSVTRGAAWHFRAVCFQMWYLCMFDESVSSLSARRSPGLCWVRGLWLWVSDWCAPKLEESFMLQVFHLLFKGFV